MSFAFKQFVIDDSRSAMKVGTDGVLLGAWMRLPEHRDECRILDIGCGSGIVSLMCAQRSSERTIIDAVEIDPDAAKDARANFTGSKWGNRINLVCGDFISYASACNIKYNVIVSNPPYFKNAMKPEIKSREMARHSSALNYDDLFFWSEKLLACNGMVAVITPWECYDDIARAATENRLFLQRRCDIRTTDGESVPKRVLTEWGRTPADYEWNCMVINGPEYKYMVRDFYINI